MERKQSSCYAAREVDGFDDPVECSTKLTEVTEVSKLCFNASFARKASQVKRPLHMVEYEDQHVLKCSLLAICLSTRLKEFQYLLQSLVGLLRPIVS